MSHSSTRVLASASTPRRRRLVKLARRSTRSFASTSSSGSRNSDVDASVVTPTEARYVERGGGAETRANASGVAAPTMVSYVVARGDSLFSIAASHGVSTDDLVEANALGLRRSVEVGQSLHVPVNIDRASFAVRAKLRATDGRVGTTPATRKLFLRDVWSPQRSSHSTMTFGSTTGKALPSLQVFGAASFVVAIMLTLVSRKPSRAVQKTYDDERQMAATVSAPVPESDALTDGGDVVVDEITETIEIRSASGKTKQISMPEPSDEEDSNDDGPRWVGEVNPPDKKGVTPTLPKSAKKVDVARLEMRANRRAQSSARRLQRSSSRTAIRQEGHGASALPALVGGIIFDLQSTIERLRSKVK